MAPTFNASDNNKVTVTATVAGRAASGLPVTEADIRQSLASLARQEGVRLSDLSVILEQGERTVTMTESEYNALVQGGAAATSSE